MKKIKMMILPLAMLSLIACNKTADSSISSSSSSSYSVSSSTTSSSSSSSSTPISSSSSSSSSSTSSSSSSSSSIDYTAGWKSDVASDMKKYLGGIVVPYYKLATNSSHQYSSWDVSQSDFGILTIEGDGVSWDTSTTPNQITTLFTNAGWTVDSKSGSTAVIAKDPTGKVTAEYSKNDIGEINLTASYDEDYDLSLATGSWSSEIVQDMNSKFEDTVPYIYLGTANPYCDSDTNLVTSNLRIWGGKWTDSVLSDAMSAFIKLGYQVSLDPTTKILSATGKAKNGIDSFEIEVKKNSNTVDKILMNIIFKEGFNPNSFTAWSYEILDLFRLHLDNHDIPVTYLGTKNPIANFSDRYNYLIIEGQTWDDSILSTAITNWVAEGWTCDDDMSDSSSPYVVFTKEIESDHCILTATIKKNYSDHPEIQVTLDPGLAIPDECIDWLDTTKATMTEKIKVVLPYFYMNTKSETATFDDSSSVLKVLGGRWVNRIGDYAYKAFEASSDDWDVEQNEYSHAVTATATINNNSYSVTIKGDSFTKDAVMTVNFIPEYIVPEDGAWNEKVLNSFNNYLHGIEIPYVYLHSDAPTAEYDDYLDSITITGGFWNDKIVDEAKKIYTKDAGWSKITYAYGDNSAYYQAEKTFSAGYKIKVRLYQEYSTKLAKLYITQQAVYVKDHTQTAWKEDTLTSMTNDLKTTLPYVYLGTASETTEYEDVMDDLSLSTGCLTIKGGSWNDQIVTDATTAFTVDGWTNHEVNSETGKAFVAYKDVTVESDTYTYVTYIYLDKEDEENPIPTVKCFRSPQATFNTTGTYSADINAGFASSTNNQTSITLPYTDLGTAATWNNGILGQGIISHVQEIKFYETLLTDTQTIFGKTYSWEDVQVNISDYDLKVTATKSLPAGGKVSITLGNRYDRTSENFDPKGILMVSYKAPFIDESGATNWNDDILAAMEDTFGEGNVIPYFYMGDLSDAEINTSEFEDYPYISFESYEWDDQIYTNMIEALENDKDASGKSYWTYMYDYASLEGSVCLWATKTADNGKHFTLQLFNNEDCARLYIYCR